MQLNFFDRPYAAFDLEIAKPIPSECPECKNRDHVIPHFADRNLSVCDNCGYQDQNWRFSLDWRQFMPLGISCAALAFVDEFGMQHVKFWQGRPQMTPPEVANMLFDLQEYAQRYTLATWNGAGFDFEVAALESGLVDVAADLCLDHVDPMFYIVARKGWRLKLDKAAAGMGAARKVHTVTLNDGSTLDHMSGAVAPELWARGEHTAVLTYLEGDVIALLDVINKIADKRFIAWTSNSGRPQTLDVRGQRLPTVKQCFDLPPANIQWMINQGGDPPTPAKVMQWIGGDQVAALTGGRS